MGVAEGVAGLRSKALSTNKIQYARSPVRVATCLGDLKKAGLYQEKSYLEAKQRKAGHERGRNILRKKSHCPAGSS